LLKADVRPGGADWGVDEECGTAVVDDGGELRTIAIPTEPGAYQEYYRQIRDAIHGAGTNPVPPEEAVAVMRLLDAGRESHARRAEVALDYARLT
jgi:predicted dehydrogenase